MIPAGRVGGGNASSSMSSPYPVELYIYDLSHGMASQFSPMLNLGFPLEGIWHTAVVVHGLEWFFGGGGGIVHSPPGGTELGRPLRTEHLGTTSLTMDQMQDYLHRVGAGRFRYDKYHLFDNNCNHFSDALARHLTGRGIPQYILDLPEMVKNSPVAQMIRPIIEQATPTSGESIDAAGSSEASSSSASTPAPTQGKRYNHFPHSQYITFGQKIDKTKVSSTAILSLH